MRCFGLWVVTAGLVVLPVVQAQERPVEGWGVATDPDNDCKIKAQKGRLTMNLPGTAHDFAAELKRWNAPRVLSKVEGDFHLEVKVAGGFNPTADSSIPGRRGYNGGGLLVVKDADNYVSLHRGAVNLDGRVRHYANFELRKNGEMDISLYEVELEDKDTVKRRIDAAAKFVPLEDLCLSPQCGFSSTHHGNALSQDDQWRKLERVVEVAREVWG